jgi:hypothetical protein
MSLFDVFLRVFFALQVGSVFLMVLAALFHEFWVEVVKRPRQCKECERLRDDPPLYVPLAFYDDGLIDEDDLKWGPGLTGPITDPEKWFEEHEW